MRFIHQRNIKILIYDQIFDTKFKFPLYSLDPQNEMDSCSFDSANWARDTVLSADMAIAAVVSRKRMAELFGMGYTTIANIN
jgi:hypothetical protein